MQENLIQLTHSLEVFEARFTSIKSVLVQKGRVQATEIAKIENIIEKLQKTSTIYHRCLLEDASIQKIDNALLEEITKWTSTAQSILVYLSRGLVEELKIIKNQSLG